MNKKAKRWKSVKGQLKLDTVADYKFFSTEGLSYGDCTCKSLQTVIRKNGTGFLSAIVRSTDSNDTWEVRTYVYDKNDVFLQYLGKKELEIKDPNTDYEYFRLGLEVNPAIFEPAEYIMALSLLERS